MADAATDRTFLRARHGVAAAVADLASAVKRVANEGQPVTPEPAPSADTAILDAWSETLARVHGAADLLRMRENQIRELEQRHREAMDRAAERIAILEQQLAAESERAQQAERAQAEALEWLGRIHKAVVDQFPH